MSNVFAALHEQTKRVLCGAILKGRAIVGTFHDNGARERVADREIDVSRCAKVVA